MRRLTATNFFVLLLILSKTRFNHGPAESDALTDSQRKEVEVLRAQLGDAFEKDEDRTLQAKGVITQPEWTQTKIKPNKAKSKVVVTKSGLNEAKALRDEISTAIKEDHYAPIVSSSRTGGDTKAIQELHQKYRNNANNNPQQSKSSDDVVSQAFKDGPILIVTSSTGEEPEIDIRKLQRLELNKRRTRETLILESIEEDFSFDLGEHVQEWEHIIHGGQEFFIGRLEKELQIVHKNALKYEASETVNIGAPISYLETYTYWNSDQQQQEGIIIVATGNEVRWFRADESLGRISLYWEWFAGSIISGLTYFPADGSHYLVVSTNQSSRAGYYALNIYQFDLKNKEFWITQRLQLAHPCGEVTLLDTGRDYIMAIPQNNTAVIYTFNPNSAIEGNIYFEKKHSFESEGVEYITAFQMGGRSYLAVGGMQPQILLYQQGDFVPKTIFGNNFGFVEFFFPIPVRTYRDDLILLVQHRVDFDSHKLTVLESLIWNGEAFEATIPAPCKHGSKTVYGVKCMLDIERDDGLKGAALLRRGDEVSVIVPRHKAESGLFRLHTKLLAKNSELKDLQEIFDFLKEWVGEHDKLIEQAQLFLKETSVEKSFDNLKLLKTPELFYTGTFRELYVNDYKWTQQDSAIHLNHVINQIEQLEHEMFRSRHKRDLEEEGEVFEGHSASFENLDFDDVEAEFLEIENLNELPFFVKSGTLDFDGILNLIELEVLEAENIKDGHQVLLEKLKLEENIEFEKINGISWHSFIDDLIFKDATLELKELEIDGEVNVENQLEISRLNSLKFPEEYLWTEGAQNQIINAAKNFTGTLTANHIDSEGHINGKDPFDIVTLSDPQEWTGVPTFTNLEVSEIFELNGTARGSGNIEEFPENPSLEDSNFIRANCEFVSLKVLGPIKIERNYNDESLDRILSDVAQRPEGPNEEIIITGEKTFSNVMFPIDFHVENNKINDIAIEQFIPSHSTQELDLNTIEGFVYFGNLTIKGLYDGIAFDEFIRNAIRIDEPQSLMNKTQLNFGNIVTADTFNVVKTLNGLPIGTSYQTLDEDLRISKVSFESLKAEECNIPDDIEGTARLNGIDLNEFFEASNSSSSMKKPRNIFLNELVLEAGLQVDQIHNLNIEFLYEFLSKVDSLPEMVLDGKIHVDRVTVNGNVQINKLNGQNFDDDIQLTVIWLNRPNYLSTHLEFIEPVDLRGELNVLGDYNNENLVDLIDDMVFRNPNGTVLILAPKNFASSMHVSGNTKVDALNGIPFNKFANKRNAATFDGSFEVKGNLIVKEIAVKGKVNEFPLEELTNQINYDEHMHAFILKGTTNLSHPRSLDDLTVYGNLNHFTNVKDIFDNLVYKLGNILLDGRYNFTGRVSIERGANVENFNQHKLSDLLNNIVYINGLEPLVVETPIVFESTIGASSISILNTLKTKSLNGCLIKDWLNDTLDLKYSQNITEPLHFAPGSLNGNNFFASFLNNIDLSKVITLNTPQNLSQHLRFSEVHLDGIINVTGSINNVDLKREFENTLLTLGNQHIRTPLTLHTVNVLKDMETKKPVNGDKPLEQVATLYEDTVFESPFFFEKLSAKNIFTKDLISGIDFNDWYKFSLWKEGKKEYHISGNWSVENLNLKSGPIMPDLILGSVRSLSSESISKELCQRFNKLLAQYSKRPYTLKHITKAFELDLSNITAGTEISKAFRLLENHLLINFGCSSSILEWNVNDKNYKLIANFESGSINQIAIGIDHQTRSKATKFISSSDNNRFNCTPAGLNLWQLEMNKVLHLKNFDENSTALWTTGFKGHIFTITDNGLKRISTVAPYSIESLELTAQNFISFTDSISNPKILYRNKTHFAHISAALRQQRSVLSPHDYINKFYRSVHNLEPSDESILKPNATLVKKLTFAEFRHVVERILDDLNNRLGIEINITQLSIPESDLYDSHLIENFIAIMEELQSQDIYPPNTFNDLKLESTNIPNNLAQVLAARTVHLVWPVIIEIVEIHRYLRENSTQDNPISACILNHLGVVIKDVIQVANTPAKIDSNENLDSQKELSAVIKRIREFQDELVALQNELKLEILEDLNTEIENEIQSDFDSPREKDFEELIEMKTNSSSTHLNDDIHYHNLSFAFYEYPKMRFTQNNELLNLEVGTEFDPVNLMAVSYLKSQITPGQPEGINLYVDILENALFQFIPAHKPRSMTSMRVRDLTLLAYIENCCTVHVMQYRGVQGFIRFAKFKLGAPITHLMELSVLDADSKRRFYFVTILNNKLIFYEVHFAGLKKAVIEPLSCE